MKDLKDKLLESILSSTGTGKDHLSIGYLKDHAQKHTNAFGKEETEEYVFKYLSVDKEGKVNVAHNAFNGTAPINIHDDYCTKLPVKFGELGCPLILHTPRLNSEIGLPDKVYSYFDCRNTELKEINYLPYIKYPLHGCVVLSIGGKNLRRINCDYRGDTIRGNARLHIYCDSKMPKEELDLLISDVQTHFEFHKKVKGKYTIVLSDYETGYTIWGYKH